MGNDIGTAELAQNYIRFVIPGQVFLLWFTATRIFLQNLSIFYPAMTVNILITVLHVGWIYLFYSKLGYGLEGLGIGTSITRFSGFVFLVLYIHFGKLSEYCWSGRIHWNEIFFKH